MSESLIPDKQIDRLQQLRKERQTILGLPAGKAMEAILHSAQPLPLVHSFPEEDLYMLVHEVGQEDAPTLLSLASNRQWEYFIDMNVWDKDRIDSDALTFWIGLLLRADPKRLMEWGLKQKTELFELYFSKNIDIRIRQHDQDPSDFGPEYFTLDETFYIRLTQELMEAENEDDRDLQKQRALIITHFLKYLSALDPSLYHSVLLETNGVIPAESEEGLLRRRNVRLAEKGFLPFDDAVRIYTPLSPEEMVKKGQKSGAGSTEDPSHYPVPLYSNRLLEEDFLFSRTLATMGSEFNLQQIQIEFAALSNQIIAADRIKVTDKEALGPVVQKAAAYLSIGLERLLASQPEMSSQGTGALLIKYPLSQIFRVGYHLALKVKWKAEKWYRSSWFERMGLPLSFWDEEGMGRVGGLLLKKPLYYDNYRSGTLYREFHSIEEIRSSEANLRSIMAFDDLLSQIPMDLEPGPDRFLTYKKLVLTLWSRQFLDLHPVHEYKALTLTEFKSLHAAILEPATGSDKLTTFQIPASIKESFLMWLKEQSGMPSHDISARLAHVLEALFKEVKDECGNVTQEDLDPHYIRLFAVEQ